MLKPIDPAKYAEEDLELRKKLEAIALVPMIILMLFFGLSNPYEEWWRDALRVVLLLASNLVSIVLMAMLWIPLSLWVGKLPFWKGVDAIEHPDRLPKMAAAVSDATWNNRVVLGAFYVAFRATVMTAIFLPLNRLLVKS
ncbi:MAG: hypothetical protein JSR60_13645 [Proteobacteria bacterium]|nr:hypothetical protein [Pseudomonadota bacterium]